MHARSLPSLLSGSATSLGLCICICIRVRHGFFCRLAVAHSRNREGCRRPDFALRLLTDLARGALRMQSLNLPNVFCGLALGLDLVDTNVGLLAR